MSGLISRRHLLESGESPSWDSDANTLHYGISGWHWSFLISDSPWAPSTLMGKAQGMPRIQTVKKTCPAGSIQVTKDFQAGFACWFIVSGFPQTVLTRACSSQASEQSLSLSSGGCPTSTFHRNCTLCPEPEKEPSYL